VAEAYEQKPPLKDETLRLILVDQELDYILSNIKKSNHKILKWNIINLPFIITTIISYIYHNYYVEDHPFLFISFLYLFVFLYSLGQYYDAFTKRAEFKRYFHQLRQFLIEKKRKAPTLYALRKVNPDWGVHISALLTASFACVIFGFLLLPYAYSHIVEPKDGAENPSDGITYFEDVPPAPLKLPSNAAQGLANQFPDKATKPLDLILNETNPEDWALYRRALDLHYKGETEKALAEFTADIDAGSRKMIDYLGRGVLRVAKGDTSIGLVWLNVAMGLAERSPDARMLAVLHLWRGAALIRTNQIRLGEKALASHFQLADTTLISSTQEFLWIEGYYTGPVDGSLGYAYRSAVNDWAFRKPTLNISGWIDKGFAALNRSRTSEAITYFKKALEKNRHIPHGYYAMGSAYLAAKNYPRALNFLDSAIHRAKEGSRIDVIAHRQRAAAHYRSGNVIQGQKDLEHYFAYASEQVITYGQKYLRNAGFYNGPTDGKLNDDYRDALTRWARGETPKSALDNLP
jgi:tetratricopeptide (TPR) repeat protein